MLSDETKEGMRNAASDDYFAARPHIDSHYNRCMFEAGFDRACRAIEAAVQRPIADLMCQWKSGKISGDELADKLFSLFASTPSSAVLAEQEKQEPVAWLARGIHGGKVIAAKLHDYKQDADNTASVFIEHYGAAETVPLYTAPVVQPDMIRPDQEALQQIIAAALYDFGGFITTRQKQLVASATDNAADTVEALKEFMEKRGINPCQDVPVLSWQCWIAAAEGKSNANVCGLPHGKEDK